MAQLVEPPDDDSIELLPEHDWLTQRELAALLCCSERTASIWAREGRFQCYLHGCPVAGRRKYSRRLVMLDLARRISETQGANADLNRPNEGTAENSTPRLR